MNKYRSWGGFPDLKPAAVHHYRWRDELLPLKDYDGIALPFGLGRSYGDSCLNEDGLLIDVSGLDKFIDWDPYSGLLRCEAGVTLAQILEFAVPQGWFPAVTPGTKYVTVGGAIANDVHGKNHHQAGTFAMHVPEFELLRSDGDRKLCSFDKNENLYRATIGGMGLTGMITWADIQLRKISNPFINVENIKFSSLDEFMHLSKDSDRDFENTVAWVDCAAGSGKIGRGIFMRGNFAGPKFGAMKWKRKEPSLTVPFNLPSFSINRHSIKAFNALYYHKSFKKRSTQTVNYDSYFYPLDSILDWNRIYGKRGFFQYQCVVPPDDVAPIREIMDRISKAGQGSFLAVLKVFGDVTSPGMLSFPRKGITLAVDVPNNGQRTLDLLDQLDEVTFAAGGALYPAKDARMSPEHFRRSYPRLEEFQDYIDLRFSSSFWRRVMKES